VDVIFKKSVRYSENLGSQNNNTGGSVTNFLILQRGSSLKFEIPCQFADPIRSKKSYLGPSNLNHCFGSRMLNSDFSEDGIAVICHDNPAHRIHQHFEHGLWAQTSADDIPNSFTGKDIFSLFIEEMVGKFT